MTLITNKTLLMQLDNSTYANFTKTIKAAVEIFKTAKTTKNV